MSRVVQRKLVRSSLAERARQDEQMDDPGLDPGIYAQVLDDLARVNRWTLAARPTLAFVRRAVGSSKRFSLLDVGSGQGDMLRAIGRWVRRHRLEADLVGIDLNSNSLAAAQAATPACWSIDFRTGDYRDLTGPFDIIVSSLVAHHMTEEELTEFIRFMEANTLRGWMINDLHRHAFAYRGYPLLARLLGVHAIVRQDGTLSIARAFRAAEWRTILAQAGLPSGTACLTRYFPFRLCVERLH